MPPTRPSLTATADSTTQFSSSVSGSDPGATNRLYYRKKGSGSDTTGPTRVGDGSFAPVSGLAARGHYLAWAVSDDGASYSLPAFADVSLAVPQTLTAAVHSHFESFPALVSLLSGGLWTGEIPEGTTPPYAWLDVDHLNSEPMMSYLDQFEAGSLRVSIFAIGAESAEACAASFKSAFDYADVAFTDDSGVQAAIFRPRSYQLRCANLRWKDTRLIFRATLTYHVLLTRPR